ncbi:MAG TPA: transposase [Chloroflexota bacterium]|nr:transposase [Chloroflexota bacterium]HUM68011.1 transposase [Chloroflexota bacterium]
MLDHTSNTSFWSYFRAGHVPLPAHLPRLALADRFQPRYVRRCPVTQRTIAQLRLLDWEQLPATLADRKQGERLVPLAAYIGAYLVRLEQQLPTFGALRRFLAEHPGLIWALGFPATGHGGREWPFDPEQSLPSQAHFTHKMGSLPNDLLQELLDGQVAWLHTRLGDELGQVVSVDTKHILAWVRENNPKEFIKEGRFDKERQPAGDPDCKVGCKRQRNQVTPTKEGQAVSEKVSIGEYYWGYASGVVATKVPGIGEFVLAEFTQTFDFGDVTYFLPLMAQVEQRLGRRPRFGTADAAFDAWYVYDYFHNPAHDGFAAVPLRQLKQGHRLFDPSGLPLCAAGLAMPCHSTFTNRTSLVQHQRGRYVCPLLHPEPTGDACPIDHPQWPDGGCKLVMPTAPGARIRYQLDRESDDYQAIYQQRTAVERIFSQAVALGIERPKLRNQRAIANQNTLIYLLINLRAMQRLAKQSD